MLVKENLVDTKVDQAVCRTFFSQVRKAYIISSQIQRCRRKAVKDTQKLSQSNEEGHKLPRSGQAVHARDVVPLERHLDVDDGTNVDQEIERPIVHGVIVLFGSAATFVVEPFDVAGCSDKGE
jgi:hypothetical protein